MISKHQRNIVWIQIFEDIWEKANTPYQNGAWRINVWKWQNKSHSVFFSMNTLFLDQYLILNVCVFKFLFSTCDLWIILFFWLTNPRHFSLYLTISRLRVFLGCCTSSVWATFLIFDPYAVVCTWNYTVQELLGSGRKFQYQNKCYWYFYLV